MSEQQASPEARIAAFLTPESERPREDETYSEAPQEAPQAAPQEAPEEAPQDAEESPDEMTIEEWNQLAEYLEADPSDLYALKVNLDTPEGPKQATIEQLKDAYKEQEKIRVQAAQVEQARLQMQQQWTQAAQSLQQKEHEAAALLQNVEQQFFQEMAQVNWDWLRQNNPAEFAALRMQYQERQTQLANLRADAAIRYENAQREQAQVQVAQERELLRQEADLLYRAIPEWRDQQVAAREKAEIAQFLLSRGYSPQYVASIKAHREVLLARDAMRLARTQQSVAKNKVFKLGKKTLTPGSRTGRAEQNNETTRTLRGKLAKSGNMKDAAALISRLI